MHEAWSHFGICGEHGWCVQDERWTMDLGKIRGQMIVTWYENEIRVEFPVVGTVGAGQLERLVPMFARELMRAQAKLRKEQEHGTGESDDPGPIAA